MPERIQLRRTRGWRKPAGAVVVARPSRWGNPWKVGDEVQVSVSGVMTGPTVGRFDPADARFFESTEVVRLSAEMAVRLYREDLVSGLTPGVPDYPADREWRQDLVDALELLRGKDLACWCPLVDERGARFPCHADVLLSVANPGWSP